MSITEAFLFLMESADYKCSWKHIICQCMGVPEITKEKYVNLYKHEKLQDGLSVKNAIL